MRLTGWMLYQKENFGLGRILFIVLTLKDLKIFAIGEPQEKEDIIQLTMKEIF